MGASRTTPSVYMLRIGVTLTLMIAAGLMLLWLDEMAALRAAILSKGSELACAVQINAERPYLEQRWQETQKRLQASGLFLDADTSDGAALWLVEALKQSVLRAQAELTRTQSLPSVAEGEQLRLVLRADVRGDEQALVSILRSIEWGSPPVTVENLIVSAADSRPGTGTEQPRRMLAIQMDLVGYWIKP